MQRRQAGASAVTVLEGNAALHGLGRDGDTLRGGDGPREPRQDPLLRLQEDEPAPASVDGFQRALLLEQHALGDALAAAPHAVQKRLIPLIADLYTMLRTPLFPRGSDRTIAAALVQTALSDDNGVYLLECPSRLTTRCAACAPFVIRHCCYNRTVTFLPCGCHPQRRITP